MKIYLDTETRSDVPISAGVHKYVKGKWFSVILLQYAIDDGPVHVLNLLDTPVLPGELIRAARNPQARFVIHNSAFDRRVCAADPVTAVLGITAERTIDTMVQALAHGLPAGLEELCDVYGLDNDSGKQKDGRSLINTFCVPTRPDQPQAQFIEPEHMPEAWERFCRYGRMDVEAMRTVHRLMPQWNYPGHEHGIWVLDQRMNDRGLPMDIELARASMDMMRMLKRRNSQAIEKATDGAATTAGQRDKLLAFLRNDLGYAIPDLRKDTVERRLTDEDTPAEIKHLLRNRLEGSLSSASKYKPVMMRECNGRLHDTIQFCGASKTGRDSGRAYQPQNLMRPTLKAIKDLEGAELFAKVERLIRTVKDGTVAQQPNAIEIISNLVRAGIRARPGHRIVSSDLSNIEGRGLVYLAEEDWKLDYFRDFDAGRVRFDNYVSAYAKAMNIAPEAVDGYGRQIGKVMELGLGYGGGVSAFLTFAAVYRLSIPALAEAVRQTTPDGEWADACSKYDWAKKHGFSAGLGEQEFTACEVLKARWRKAHPKVVQFWSNLEMHFRMAMDSDKTTFHMNRHLAFRRDGQWLRIRLPSGRVLCYLQPATDKDGNITYRSRDQKTKRFERIKTYGGKLSENVTSAFAREVMFQRLPDIEADGYNVILRVHDQIVTEQPNGDGRTHERLSRLMATPHPWCADLPLAAAGFENQFFWKD